MRKQKSLNAKLEKLLPAAFFFRKKFRVLAAASLLFLSGCMVGPNYQSPCLSIPESYRYEIQSAKNTLDALWWEQFEDPLLSGYIQEALENNKDLKAAAANVEKALGLLVQVRSQLFPQFSYSGAGLKERQSTVNAVPIPAAVSNPETAFQAVLNTGWDIDLWGRTRRQVEAARAELFATEEAKKNIILSLVASVASTYIQLVGFDAQLRISEKTLEDYRQAVVYFETQFSYGQVSKMNVAQALTQYETAAATIPQIKAEINQTENAFSVLLGRNPGPIARTTSLFDIKMPQVPAAIPSEILYQRPDVVEAEQNLIAANAEIGAAVALYFPSISLTGYFGNASQQLKDLFTGPARTWNYTGSIVGPIFTWGSISGQVEQAKAAKMAALFNYEAVIQNAFAEVETALSSYSMLKEKLVAQKNLVDAATEYERLAKLQYDSGYSPYIAVLQAQIQLFPAELSWVQAKASFFNALVNIYGSMGGGWIIEAEKASY